MRIISVRFSYIAAVVGIAGLIQVYNAPTSAAAPNPDSCFTTTGTRIDSYDVNGVGCGIEVEIPTTIGGETIETIGNNAFNTTGIVSVIIPSSVITIEGGAFYENLLTSVTIPGSVTSIGSYAFYSNQLTSVTIPNSVTSIGGLSFADNQLTSVVISNMVTSIGDGAFQANQLLSVIIPNSVTSIGNDTFRANLLSSVTIPASVTSIGPNSFANNQLTSVVIPSSVTSIDDSAFILQSADPEELFADFTAGDPVRLQEAIDSIWYTRLYTEDPSNPNGLQDAIVVQDLGSGPINFGGHLINPSNVTLDFVGQNGQALQDSQTFTSPNHSSYMVASGPVIPFPVDPFSPTPEESQAILDALGVFYRIGDTFSYTAPIVDGVTPTPAQYSFVLGASDVNPTRQFVYGVTINSGALSNTGTSVWMIVVIAGMLIAGSAGIAARR